MIWLLQDSYWPNCEEFNSNVHILGVQQIFVKNKLINAYFHNWKFSQTERKCGPCVPRVSPVIFFIRISLELKCLLSSGLNILYIWVPVSWLVGEQQLQCGDRAVMGSLWVSGGDMFCAGLNSGLRSTWVSQQFWSFTQEGGSDWVRSTKVNLLVKIIIQHLHFRSTLQLLMSCSSKWAWKEGWHLHPYCTNEDTETRDASDSLEIAQQVHWGGALTEL